MMKQAALIAVALALLLAGKATPADDGRRYLTFAGFELGKHNLGDVQNRLGKAQIEQSGDAGESDRRICYRVPNGAVEFFSGEMGGSDNELLGFQLSSQSMSANCARWPTEIPVALQIDRIHIGMSRTEFVRATDAPVGWAGRTGALKFSSERIVNGVTWERGVLIFASFDDDLLTKLVVTSVESN